MCDALSRNTAGEFEAILSNCNAHARRRYVDVAPNFPEECRYVLETLREVYRTDGRARAQGLSPQERLLLHQQESGPRMEKLEAWLREQIAEHHVEPNSGLGEAIGYMHKHWQELTLFLRVPGAPLGRVGHWRGGRRSRGVAVSGRFRIIAGASCRAVAPSPVPSRRTVRAAFPHTALFRVIRPSLSPGREGALAV